MDTLPDLRGLRAPIASISLSLKNVRELFELLHQIVQREGRREVSKLVRGEDMSPESHQARKELLLENAFRVTVTLTGADGERIFLDNVTLFDAPQIPADIATVYMTNTMAYSAIANGVAPNNSFSLLLDFSKQPLIDTNRIPSAPTPNESHYQVAGSLEWVAAIKDTLEKFFRAHKNGRSLFHMANVYDLGLLVLALPLSFYACWKLSSFINVSDKSGVLVGGIYVYIVLLGLWLYRGLFGYLKWAFPVVELTDNSRARTHRAFWFAAVCAILSPAVYDLGRYLFT